jgi:hypothetical protein
VVEGYGSDMLAYLGIIPQRLTMHWPICDRLVGEH